jgi:tetratricopeptide (TPR) repeat protein
MISWAIAGTLAWTYLKQKASEKLKSKAEDIAIKQGGKFFSGFVNQLKEKIPVENNHLIRAHRRACLVATQHICAELNASLGGDNLPSFLAKPRNLLLGAVPTSLSGQNEKAWLVKANNYLQSKIKEIDNNLAYLPEQASDEYQTLVVPAEAASPDQTEDFRLSLTENALAEIILALNEEPPPRFIEAMQNHWFRLVCDEFQISISSSPLLSNIFQNKLIVEIALDTETIKIQLDEFLKPLPELIQKEAQETRKKIDESTEKILEAVTQQKTEKGLPSNLRIVQGFVGREDYLAELHESYKHGTASFVLHGIGGVGKTATALQFAGEIAEKYKYEAKIFVDMRGMSKNPLSARDALFDIVVRRFEKEVPADIPTSELKDYFVELVQSQPTLIVLDNAKDKESVETFNQANACLIITSRQSFALTRSYSKQIIKMSPEDARKLLFEIAGENRFDGRADELAYLAGYLPMALKPLASILAEDELETAANLIEKYRNKQELLKERVPDYEDLTVEASFELSYEALPDEMKERWRRLSVFPADFDEPAIAAVLNISDDEAKETQRLLRKFNLLEVNPETRRFNLHDLIRVFSDTKISESERFKTQLFHSLHYSFILRRANDIKLNDRENGYIKALKLIDVEWSNIIAGQKCAANFIEKDNNIAEFYLNYSGSDNEFLALRLHPQEHIDWQEAGLRAAKKLGNKQAEGGFLGNLGSIHFNLGEFYKAIEYQEQHLAIAREINDRQGESNGLGNLGNAYFGLGKFPEAIDYYEQSLLISRKISYQLGEARFLGNLGNVYLRLGEYQKAIEYYRQDLTISREIGNLQSEGSSLSSLGSAYHSLGDPRKAVDYHKQALEIFRKIGNLKDEGGCLGNLANAYLSLGEREKACGLWKEALIIFEAIESPNAKVIRQWIKTDCGEYL